jgi:hypothetical protein
MNKLEYYILKIFQKMMITNNTYNRYIYIEGNLLAIIKGEGELDLYVRTEVVLDGRVISSLRFSKVVDGLYKVVWSNQFLYLIGEIDKSKLQESSLSKELELLSVSSSPLSNYIKTL